MKILYGTNEHFYSKLHRKLVNEPFTHVGLLFFSGSLNIVLDCTKPYSKVYHLEHWRTKYKILETQELSLPKVKETKYYKKAVNYCLLKPYDWGAYIWAWLWVIKRIFTKEDFPTMNPWRTDGLWCTEVVFPLIEDLKEDFGIDLSNIDLAAKTPYMLFNIIKEILDEDKAV